MLFYKNFVYLIVSRNLKKIVSKMETILSFVLGGVLSFLISKYFYRKSLQKNSLKISLNYFSTLFDNIDSEIKQNLKLVYKGNEIQDINSIEFTIENDGTKPLRDIIKPLTLSIPKDFEILDANVQRISPNGREVNVSIDKEKNVITIYFPLLNPKENFILKILYKGSVLDFVKRKKMERKKYTNENQLRYPIIVDDRFIHSYFHFNITADELSPSLSIKRINKEENKKPEFVEVLFYLLIGIIINYVLWNLTLNTEYNIFDYALFFKGFFWTWLWGLSFFRILVLITWSFPLVITFRYSIYLIHYIVNFLKNNF